MKGGHRNLEDPIAKSWDIANIRIQSYALFPGHPLYRNCLSKWLDLHKFCFLSMKVEHLISVGRMAYNMAFREHEVSYRIIMYMET